MTEAGGLGQSVETREGVEGLIGDRGLAVGRGIEGARPKLELGRELYAVDAVGRYLSGEVRTDGGALYDGLGSVWDFLFFFSVTVALRVLVRPTKAVDSRGRCSESWASATSEDHAGCKVGSCSSGPGLLSSHVTCDHFDVATGLRLGDVERFGLNRSDVEVTKGGTYDLYSS